jgi:hypothetical protein
MKGARGAYDESVKFPRTMNRRLWITTGNLPFTLLKTGPGSPYP